MPNDDALAFDSAQATAVLERALALVGGAELVVGSLAGVPGTQRTPARKSMFRSSPEQVQVGQWRYEVTTDGRLSAGHVVAGIVLAELTLPSHQAAAHVAAALAEHVADQGARIVPAVRSMLEGLAVAAGP
jgi:hypothetical protein